MMAEAFAAPTATKVARASVETPKILIRLLHSSEFTVPFAPSSMP
jgi:hypothetical protein